MGYCVLPGYCLKFSPGLVLLTCLRTNMKTEGKTINTSQSNHEVRNISTSIKCSRLNRAISMVLGGVFNYAPFESSKPVLDNPWEVYGGFAIILYLFRYLSLLALPQALASFFGLLFNALFCSAVRCRMKCTSFEYSPHFSSTCTRKKYSN